MFTYTIHGLKVQSFLKLPGLTEEEGAADLGIAEGAVPPDLPGGTGVRGCFRYTDEKLLLTFPDAGRFLVSADEVLCERAPHATDSDLRAVLSGIVIAAVLQKKNRFALHASAIEWDGKAVLFCGSSGTGKSILAAALLQKGARFISDDITCVSLKDGVSCACAGPRELCLWPDSLCSLGNRPEDYGKLRPALEKRIVPVANAVTEAIPIGTVFFLLRRKENDTGCRLLNAKPCDKLALFGSRESQSFFLGNRTAAFPHFENAAKVANQARVFVLDGKYRNPSLEETTGLVLGCLTANRNPPR